MVEYNSGWCSAGGWLVFEVGSRTPAHKIFLSDIECPGRNWSSSVKKTLKWDWVGEKLLWSCSQTTGIFQWWFRLTSVLENRLLQRYVTEIQFRQRSDTSYVHVPTRELPSSPFFLSGLRWNDLYREGDTLYPISILSNIRRRGPIQVSHHVGRCGGILGPFNVSSPVGIQFVDEVNQLVGHVSGPAAVGQINVWYIGTVRLDVPGAWLESTSFSKKPKKPHRSNGRRGLSALVD